jgi:hypothetical protein
MLEPELAWPVSLEAKALPQPERASRLAGAQLQHPRSVSPIPLQASVSAAAEALAWRYLPGEWPSRLRAASSAWEQRPEPSQKSSPLVAGAPEAEQREPRVLARWPVDAVCRV